MTVAHQKSIYYDCMCIVNYVRISKRLSDNIRKTKRVVSVKISSHDVSFTFNHFTFPFLWKTYSPVSDGFCNLTATRVLVRTNGEDVKNIQTAHFIISIVNSCICTTSFDMILFFYSISVNPYFFKDKVKKITTSLLFLYCLGFGSNKIMQTFII